MSAVDPRDGNTICRHIDYKIGAVMNNPPGRYTRDDLEIVLGPDTERTILDGANPNWYTPDGQPAAKPTSLKGAMLLGVVVTIDTATPRLSAVRVRHNRRKP